MKRYFHIAITAAVFMGTATAAAANPPSWVLNRLEVQKLVASETPIANLRLAGHFSAVAARYSREAAGHRSMAAAYRVNPNRAAASSAADHCERQAAIAAEWADASRNLAGYHAALAAHRPSVFPKGAAELQGGRGAPEPTAAELHKLALLARTRTDHFALHEYYATLAKKRIADAEYHVRMAAGYRAGVHKGAYDGGVNFDRLAQAARKAAKDATEAANRHRQLASVA
jgi:hypothetical protein